MRLVTILIALTISSLFATLPLNSELSQASKQKSILGGTSVSAILPLSHDSTQAVLLSGLKVSLASQLDKAKEDIKFENVKVGYGDISALGFSFDKKTLWATTEADSFIVGNNIDAFLPTGTGVHSSKDFGKTWQSFKHPGTTPIYGLTYDIAGDDLGQIWLACYAQGLQVSANEGQSWKIIFPDSVSTDSMQIKGAHKPYPNYAHRIFSSHFSPSKQLWIGTYGGLFLNTNKDNNISINDFKDQWSWKSFKTPALTGNFIYKIETQKLSNGKELLWVASWSTGDSNQKYGVSMTADGGKTWQQFLLNEMALSFGFMDDKVLVGTTSGLWIADTTYQFEKFKINAYSSLSNRNISNEIKSIYSVNYNQKKLFVGTTRGLLVSDDKGQTFTLYEGYKQQKDKVYAYPVPYSPTKNTYLKFYFNLAQKGAVSCSVYNFAMEKVGDIVKNKDFSAGDNYFTWDGIDGYNRQVANGVYFFVIKKDGQEFWNKFLVFD